jgi:hypothetical protein
LVGYYISKYLKYNRNKKEIEKNGNNNLFILLKWKYAILEMALTLFIIYKLYHLMRKNKIKWIIAQANETIKKTFLTQNVSSRCTSSPDFFFTTFL